MLKKLPSSRVLLKVIQEPIRKDLSNYNKKLQKKQKNSDKFNKPIMNLKFKIKNLKKKWTSTSQGALTLPGM